MPRTINLIPNLAAFLDVLAFSEGTTKFGNNEGYDVIVGGELFTSFKDHPNKAVSLPKLGIKSTAAGRYQILARYYKAYKASLNLVDFGPVSQDMIAIQMIKEQKALKLIAEGHFEEAVAACSNIWASLPGAGYGQHENKMEILKAKYIEFGGKLNV